MSDNLYIELTKKGYQLVSSGSIKGPEDFTYSAYLFINPDLSPLYGASEPTEETLVVAFYRWDGYKNELLIVQRFPSIAGQYAVGAVIVNWDYPIFQGPILDFMAKADELTKQILKQENFSSDINQNGFPEFAFTVEYCPVSCSHPTGGVQLFEIQNTSNIVNITKDLPGLTFFKPHTVTPFTFYIDDFSAIDIYNGFDTYWIYVWEDTQFVDISSHYAEEYLLLVKPVISEIESQYGKPFDEGGIQREIDSLKILKLYEKAGLRGNGLQAFLEVTDLSHWPNTSNLSKCWLQVSRAMATNDVKQNQRFTMPPSSHLWEENLNLVEYYEKPLREAGYDTSACSSLRP